MALLWLQTRLACRAEWLDFPLPVSGGAFPRPPEPRDFGGRLCRGPHRDGQRLHGLVPARQPHGAPGEAGRAPAKGGADADPATRLGTSLGTLAHSRQNGRVPGDRAFCGDQYPRA